MSVARSRETATQASERALLRRDFAEAHRLSKEGIDDIIQSSGAEGNTRDLGRQDVGQKDLPVVSLRPSESSDQLNKVSRLVVVFLQASAEIFQRTRGASSARPSEPISPEILSSSYSTSTNPVELAPAVPSILSDAYSVVTVFQYVGADAIIPYPASLVWLTYLSAIGHRERAKASILKFLRSYEGSLYLQGHWRAIAAGCHDDADDPASRLRAQSRYEHLVETLVLDVLVPLKEKKMALDFLSQRTDGLSDSFRKSLRRTVEDGHQGTGISDASCVRSLEATPSSRATNVGATNVGATNVRRGRDNQATTHEIASSGSPSKYRRDESREPEKGLSREDVEILAVSAVSFVVGAAGMYLAWRKRGSIIARLQRLGALGKF